MKVVVIFEFKGLDADGEVADQIIDEIGKTCETLGKQFDTTDCYVDDVLVD
jgi:hypothetical protein